MPAPRKKTTPLSDVNPFSALGDPPPKDDMSILDDYDYDEYHGELAETTYYEYGPNPFA